MNTYQYIPIGKGRLGRSYIFRVALAQKGHDGWIAWIDMLPGCAAWGYTQREALEALAYVARVHIETVLRNGLDVPNDIGAVDVPVIAVRV